MARGFCLDTRGSCRHTWKVDLLPELLVLWIVLGPVIWSRRQDFPFRGRASVTLCTPRDGALVTLGVNRHGLALILSTIDAVSCPLTSS